MKKIITTLIGFILVLTFNSTIASSTWLIDATWSTNTWSIDTSSIENSTYVYYYGQWCSYCANVDEYMEWVDGYEKLNITKKEIYFNDDNRAEYLAAWERFGIAESDLWIPFLVINNSWEESFLIWDVPIIDHYKPFLWEPVESSSKFIILAILWALVIIIPLALIKFPNKN